MGVQALHQEMYATLYVGFCIFETNIRSINVQDLTKLKFYSYKIWYMRALSPPPPL